MKSALLFFFFLIIGASATVFLLTSNTKKEVEKPQKTATIQTSKFSLEEAPAQSLRGSITSLSGDVEWQSRTATRSAPISLTRQIQQAELLKTGRNGEVTVSFPNLTISLSENTELEFVQTLPVDFVVRQTDGQVEYTNQSSTSPLSVRVMHLLIRQDIGSLKVALDYDTDQITVDVIYGSAIFAFNDTENKSNLKTIKGSSRVIFDDKERTIKTKPLTQ